MYNSFLGFGVSFFKSFYKSFKTEQASNLTNENLSARAIYQYYYQGLFRIQFPVLLLESIEIEPLEQVRL